MASGSRQSRIGLVLQIRIHGCGGQGVVTSAELLSLAAFIESIASLAAAIRERFAGSLAEGNVAAAEAAYALEPTHAYEVDLDYCKGCGVCAQECPCGAIKMEAETI
jgi:Pyruvate/2-oxoacid:ferredoxin oxidoreductase gamma subunit